VFIARDARKVTTGITDVRRPKVTTGITNVRRPKVTTGITDLWRSSRTCVRVK